MLRIKEAVERLNENEDQKMNMIDLGRDMWPNSTEQTQRMNISNMATGKVKRIAIDHVIYLCKKLKCSADFLFGISKK